MQLAVQVVRAKREEGRGAKKHKMRYSEEGQGHHYEYECHGTCNVDTSRGPCIAIAKERGKYMCACKDRDESSCTTERKCIVMKGGGR